MSNNPPDALLFITSGCVHCPVVLDAVTELVKLAQLGKATVINAAVHPELAEKNQVRTVPWLKLGDFILTGAHTLNELKQWVAWCNTEVGTSRYIEYLLQKGVYKQAASYIAADLGKLKALLHSIANIEASIDVRLGISALLESHALTPEFKNLLPTLETLSKHADHRVRTDACHLLGLTGLPGARAALQHCLNDTHAEVREIAQDALDQLPSA